MLTNSKARSPKQLKHYHDREFSAVKENYYTHGDHIVSEWHGRGAAAFGLVGSVGKLHFDRLADGQHPRTGAQLVNHQTSRVVNGKMSMKHRAGWDLTFNCPKDGSLTALVGGDDAVRRAHVESVTVALDVVEHYVQARLGGHRRPETTGAWVAGRFEHDSARPVKGYAAPHLHTHVVVFNMTQRADGQVGPIDPLHLFRKTQRYATAIYRAEFAGRLTALGYEVTVDPRGVPSLAGFTKDYLEAASPRRQQILAELVKQQRHGARAAQAAAHQTREKKLHLSPELVQRQHQEMAAAYGHQPRHVVDEARRRLEQGLVHEHQPAHVAVTYARARNSERYARFDERQVLTDALVRATGQHTFGQVRDAFEQHVAEGKFIEVPQHAGVPARAFTTPELLTLERENIATMRAGQQTQPALAHAAIRRDLDHYPHLNDGQRRAVEQILTNRDTVQALQGFAGVGKTTALSVIQDLAHRDGYVVLGLAPTSGAVGELNKAGIRSITLQQHNTRLDRNEVASPGRALYVLDESSLASNVQMHRFLGGLQPHDRVLLVGDIKQHEAVDAGRPFAQLQDAGVAVARLDVIVRQQDHPQLLEAIEHLAGGRVLKAVELFEGQGRIHEITDKDDRYTAIAETFVKAPEGTLVISPDNESRLELNAVIHRTMQQHGYVHGAEVERRVLVTRQDLTGADRGWATHYQPDDVIRYTKGSAHLGITAGSYARVLATDGTHEVNRITVRTDAGTILTYDPSRLSGVMVYQEHERQFAVGDRVQFTAPDRPRDIANRQRGTIEQVTRHDVTIALDAGGRVTIPATERQHLDYGYAMTSYSSQAATVDRVLLHIDVDQPGTLVNNRLAYVGPSRAREDVQIFTNDQTDLGRVLSREHSHESALDLDDTRQHARAVSTPVEQLQMPGGF